MIFFLVLSFALIHCKARTLKVNLLIVKSFLLIFIYISLISQAHSSYLDVWQVLRNQFALNHEPYQPAVQKQIRWLSAHPEYIQKLAKQSEPYIYHILTEIKKRRLPGELALLPMIESAYDPFAYSTAGAAGLWQLMPGTGSDLGLKQDWWFDGRRSIDLSTDAALNYLQYLHKFFKGNWLLALAAYDSGEGTVAKALKATRRSSGAKFWTLNVPRETKAYIPRLLAIAEVIKNPQRYNITLPKIPYEPYFIKVDVGSQIDLTRAAKMAELNYEELIKLNAGHNRWATAPYQPHHLLIPKDKVDNFTSNLENIPKEKRVSWQRHQVKKGETLSDIAEHYHTTVNLIKKINSLKSNRLKLNQFLLIPGNTYSAALLTKNSEKIQQVDPSANESFRRVIHIVQLKDSFSSLEKKYGVTAAQIRFWNHLPSTNNLAKGTQLIIWKHIKSSGHYTIKSGDTLSVIAKRYNTSVKTLLHLNPGIREKYLRPRQKIKLG
ncbi:membrane bound lytic murein transglycosylase D [Legionella israelensis]|uniref:Membrane bound lytic murein transglycosylase D n=1 Tax=Legionella israelensis TaxID=454 RepID=A0A0W0VH58_9GAMM|nr:membrane bound lytic murein transglycosylase D [Legionella israelensis]QBS08660.1 LysM peptidoglycan-binding domain-containing protein [Legionella israelensis]SCY46079.1 membrane-bound lytic murein transglycosylase D [Legionella israelensis DSM 19235]STX58324.1 membrane bound lytic murein transglycosylase D [Legionella israelensis]